MTQLRLDKVSFTGLTDVFINYATPTSTITISGSVANGATENFSTTVAVDRSDSIADIYAENRNTGEKRILNAGSVHNPYQFVSSETARHNITYSGGIITVTLSVFNGSGSLVNLTSQIWDITVVLYEVSY